MGFLSRFAVAVRPRATVNSCRQAKHASGNHARLSVAIISVAFVCLLFSVSSAGAAGVVGWKVSDVAEPSEFASGDAVACERNTSKCDRYQLLVTNVGSVESSGPVSVTVSLPAGVTTLKTPESGFDSEEEEWKCLPGGAGNSVVK